MTVTTEIKGSNQVGDLVIAQAQITELNHDNGTSQMDICLLQGSDDLTEITISYDSNGQLCIVVSGDAMVEHCKN